MTAESAKSDRYNARESEARWQDTWDERGILVRWAKKASNYLGFIELDSALLWYRQLKRLSLF